MKTSYTKLLTNVQTLSVSALIGSCHTMSLFYCIIVLDCYLMLQDLVDEEMCELVDHSKCYYE